MTSPFTGGLLASVLLLLGPLSLAAAAPGRAVWAWEEESYAMLERGSSAKEALRFCGSKGINTIYLYADSYKGRNLIEKKPGLYRKLIASLHKGGLRVYALLGSWHLHTEEYVRPERRAEALAMLKRVLDYNSSAGPLERFDGVNLDLEPHMLADWKTDRDRLLLSFLDMGGEMMAMKKAAGAALKIGPAVPFWLDGIVLEWDGRKKPVSEHILDIYDYAALMAYRDRAEGADGMVALAAGELKYAGAIGKEVVVGVEVTPNDIRKVSFDRKSEAEMEWELLLAADAFGKEPAFGGFALHHFGSYRDWLRRWEGPARERND